MDMDDIKFCNSFFTHLSLNRLLSPFILRGNSLKVVVFYHYPLYSKACFFVDLFVRVSNEIAVNMYENLGYVVYRRVLEYYSGDPDEDAFGRYSGCMGSYSS